MYNYLTDLILLVNNIVGVFIVVRFMNHLLVIRPIKEINRRLVLVGIIVMATIVNIYFENIMSNLILGVLIFLLIGHLFYQGKLHIKLIVAIFIVVFSLITELLTAVIFGLVFGELIQDIRDNTMYFFLGGIASKILLLLLVEMIIRFRKRNVSSVSLSSWLFIISIPIVSIILSILIIYEPIVNNEFSNMAIVSCLSILYIDIVAFYLFDNISIQIDENNKVRYREKQLLMQQSQYENIISGHNQVEKVRHDMLGHLIAVDGYLTKSEVIEAKSYIRKLHHEIDFTSQGILSENVAVDAIINNRKAKAEKKGINIIPDIMLPKKIQIDDLDLCVVVGNALTNAIEACQRIEENVPKNIQLGIKYKRASLIIVIRNPYDPNTLRVKNGKYASSKPIRIKDEAGIGLANIETVVKKYGGIYEVNIELDEFVIKLILPDKKVGEAV